MKQTDIYFLKILQGDMEGDTLKKNLRKML